MSVCLPIISLLMIFKSLSRYRNCLPIYTKETKTENSDRTIKLPSQAFEVLKEYRVWQSQERLGIGDKWVSTDRIFTQFDGKPVHPDSITGWFREFIAKTDLPQITIHSLRHTNITLLLAAGVPLRTVSYRAGHAQTSTTQNIYAHAIRTADEMASEALDDILTPKSNIKKLG
jgi:integrase